MDNLMMSGQVDADKLPSLLAELKDHAVAVNKEWSSKLGINQATAVTCVKPSGTVSQLVNASSGIHTRFSHYYIRTVRADKKDPLAQFMKDSGFPVEDDKMRPDSVFVFSFPMESPKDAIVSDSLNAIQQLEIWKTYQIYWCEHKPSVTIQVKEYEWPEVQAWVWNNFDEISGVSFLPFDDHVYEQAPYQPINQEQYADFLAKVPTEIDWSGLRSYETAETTTGGDRDFACVGGSCEIVDVGV
jgi:ribonucleoside-diphosphate reductase alpha chain